MTQPSVHYSNDASTRITASVIGDEVLPESRGCHQWLIMERCRKLLINSWFLLLYIEQIRSASIIDKCPQMDMLSIQERSFDEYLLRGILVPFIVAVALLLIIIIKISKIKVTARYLARTRHRNGFTYEQTKYIETNIVFMPYNCPISVFQVDNR